MSLLFLLACTGGDPTPPTKEPPAEPERTPLRIGWQTTWATQGQLTAILMKTELLKEQGFEPEFVGFSYGGPLNEGALAGEVDVLFTADQPALMLHSKDDSWKAIGRLMYNRVGTFVPPDSKVQTPADLKGKTIAIPFGAAAQRETLRAVKEAGLDPEEDIKTVNLGINEQVALVRKGAEDGRWGTVDAGSAWDPAYADLERAGLVRPIAQGTVTSVVMMDQDYVTAHPDTDERFMKAFSEAYRTYAKAPEQADTWFTEVAKLDFAPGVLSLAASVEPNLAQDPPRVTLNTQDRKNLERASAFMVSAGLLKQPVAIEGFLAEGAAK